MRTREKIQDKAKTPEAVVATYLEVVNNVLCRLREASVSSVQSDSHSKLIGELVNDAKRTVEDAFRWSKLFNSQNMTTVAGTEAYDLSGTNERSIVYSIVASDGTSALHTVSPQYWNNYKYERYKDQQGRPAWYKVDANGTSGVLSVSVLPVPDVAVSYEVATCDPQDDLGASDDDTTIKVPWQPIALRAWAYAIKERGEDQGASSMEALRQFEQSLGRAIAMDARNAPPKLWQVV